MFVFIDESGDAGFKINKGSSSHFIVTLVLFADKKEASRADEYFIEIRKQLNLRLDFEFHFHKTSRKICSHFFSEISRFDFQYFSIVIDKSKIDAKEFYSPQVFYNFACELVCRKAKDYLKGAIVVLMEKLLRNLKPDLEIISRKM